MRGVGHLLFDLLELVRHLLLFAGHLGILLLRLAGLRAAREHLAETILIIGLVFGQLASLLRQLIHLLRRILALHPVQDVARFLQPLGRALLTGTGFVGIRALRILGLPHVVSGASQAIQRLLELRFRGGIGALRAVPIGLAGRLLSLLTRFSRLTLLALLPLLALLSLLGLLLLRRITACELL